MGGAAFHIEKVKNGETVQFRPRGNSMVGNIDWGDLCTVVPANEDELEVGEMVLCKVGGAGYLHLIKAKQGDSFQIGNNRGRINGWVGINGIFGRCVGVEK